MSHKKVTELDVLRKAQDFLWSGSGPNSLSYPSVPKYQFLCHAVDRAARELGIPYFSAYPLRREISHRVKINELEDDRGACLEHWLVRKLRGPSGGLPQRKVQRHRREWLLHLIEEAQANGGKLKRSAR